MELNWKIKPFELLTLQELYEIMVLRQAVFIVEQNCPYLDCDGKDQCSHHLMGYNPEAQLVAYARVVPPGISYPEASIGRVITAQKVRRHKAGIALMQQSIKAIHQIYGNKMPIRISAQSYLEKFYASFGFELTGKKYLEDNIPHSEMLLLPTN